MATPGQMFAADFGRFKIAMGAQMQALARASIQAAAGEVVADTPVDTGFLRGSWQPSIGKPPPLAKEGDDRADLSGAEAFAALAITVMQVEIGDVMYFANNAAYAMRINYGFVGVDSLGRRYNQQGYHFVEAVWARWPDIVREQAISLNLT